MKADEQIYNFLNQNNISYTKHEHSPVFTVEEADKINGSLDGISAKTLLVFGEKSKKFYLISLEGHERIDKTKIKELLGERIRFSKEEDLLEILNVKPGSVSPLGLIFDQENKISNFIIDQKILDAEIVQWHPNSNDQTLLLNKEDFQKFLNLTKHKILVY